MRLVYRLVLLVLILVLTILLWTQTDQTERSGLGQPRNGPIKLKNRVEDDDFDRRQRRRNELKDEINSDLIKLIKHDTSRAKDIDRASQLLLEAGRNNVIDGEIFGLLGELVKNVDSRPNPKPKSTVTSSSSKPNVPPMAPQLKPRAIDPIVQVKPNPSVVLPHPDALYDFVKPIVDLKFEEIKLSDSTFVDIIDKLNVKRKFLFDKRLKNEQKRINTEHTLKTADVKRQKQLDVINAKLPAGVSSAPGPPPIKGAQFINGGWLMPRVQKPNLIKEDDNKKNELTSNPIPVEELKKIREGIIAKNEVVATGPYSSSQREEPFEFIIIVQVHSRHDFLEFLLSTIEKQSNLENALLVISTDISNSEVEQVISKIEFMNHVHIVFPNSAQFYSGEFPATTPNDCFPLKHEEAKTKKCLNYPWPDTFGNYREAKISNIKHHWWWKLNFVNQFFHFNKLILLEEDHALANDAFNIIGHMNQFKCDNRACDLYSLGNYQNNLKLSQNVKKYPPNQVHLTDWTSTQHNMGMVVDHSWVDKVISMSDDFCLYDDYNWDWTLMHLSAEIIKPATTRAWKVALPAMARSQHMGITGCGTHFQKGGCNFESIREMFEKDQRALMDAGQLYPAQMTAAALKARSVNVIQNGGWGDLRDIFMCRSISRNALNIDMSFLDHLTYI